MFVQIAVIILAYFSGSIASALLVSRALGLEDPRDKGSGNPGATNMLRLYGKIAAILTLTGDVLKGLLPVLLAGFLELSPVIIVLTGLAAFIGHLYPVFFGFRGGKGVATLVGILFGSHWLSGLLFIGTWLLVAVISRYSSLSALLAAALSPLYIWLILDEPVYIAGFGLMAVLLFWRHRDNIRSLLAGTEGRIGANTGE